MYSWDGSPPVKIEDYYAAGFSTAWFAPDGDRLIWTDRQNFSKVHVWSLSAGKEVRTFEFEAFTYTGVVGDRLILFTFMSGAGLKGKTIVREWGFDENDPKEIARWERSELGGFPTPEPAWRWIMYRQGRALYVCPPAELGRFRGRLVGEHPFELSRAAFDPSGERIASADTSGEIRIWSVEGSPREPLRVFHGDNPVRGLQFDPSGTYLTAICRPKQKIYCWDLNAPWDAAPTVLRTEQEDLVQGHPLLYNFDPAGRWIVATYLSGVAFWPLERPSHWTMPGSLANFDAEGRVVIDAGNGRLRLQSPDGGSTRDFMVLDRWSTNMVEIFDPLRRYMVVAGEGLEGLNLVSLSDGGTRRLPDEPPGGLFSVPVLSLDGKYIAADRIVSVGDSTEQKITGLRVWNLERNSFRILEGSKGMELWTLAFSEDGSLFSGDHEGNILRWNVKDGTSTTIDKSKLTAVNKLATINGGRDLLACTASSSNVTQAYTSALKVYDLEKRTSRAITTHGNKIIVCDLDSAKTQLATFSADGTIRVGPVAGEEPHLLFMPAKTSYPWAFVSPDGNWIVCAGAPFKEYTLWRTPQGRPIQTLPHKEFLEYLRAQTNWRVVQDRTAQAGYRVDTVPFPGLDKLPPQR